MTKRLLILPAFALACLCVLAAGVRPASALCGDPTGDGSIKTTETVTYEIFREIMRSARQFEAKEMLVMASSDVISRLLEDQSTALAELEDAVNLPVRLQA